LAQQEYCGDVINFKTYSKSYKNKKRLDNDVENMAIFQDVHKAIIDRATFEKVQVKRGNTRKRQTSSGERNIFSGLLICADCGHNLHFHFNQANHDIKYFNCSNYKGNRGTCETTHYIRVDFLEQVVLAEIRRLTKFATQHEDIFTQAVMGYSQKVVQQDIQFKQKELNALLAREDELDGLFEKIYEDNVSGKLSDDRFSRMSRRYEDEQAEIGEKVKTLKFELQKGKSQTMTGDMFISAVRKYTRVRKLTPRMLNELIEKIEVYHSEKKNGVQTQNITIHYNCIGSIEIPEDVPLEFPDITLPTRRGVAVTYAPLVAASC
jgi:site-specific DNA recombinase